MNIIDARKDLSDNLSAALRTKGFTVAQNFSGRLFVNDATGLRLGQIDFWGVSLGTNHYSGNTVLTGSVRFAPVVYGSGTGRYALDVYGNLNTKNLIARLQTEGKRVRARNEAALRVAAQTAADDAVLATLPRPDGVDVSVYEGKVDIKFVDISPDFARRILADFRAEQERIALDAEAQTRS